MPVRVLQKVGCVFLLLAIVGCATVDKEIARSSASLDVESFAKQISENRDGVAQSALARDLTLYVYRLEDPDEVDQQAIDAIIAAFEGQTYLRKLKLGYALAKFGGRSCKALPELRLAYEEAERVVAGNRTEPLTIEELLERVCQGKCDNRPEFLLNRYRMPIEAIEAGDQSLCAQD